jgi:putative protein-disulfide isomerase
MMDQSPKQSIVYVMDAYCGWCWGFSARLTEFEAANRNRVAFTAVSGGLFTGVRVAPIAAYPHIPEARFGSAYDQLLQAGEMVMNSLDAAAALAVLRELAPERAIQWAHQLQQAFYERGQSLSERATIARIASEGGLDARAVLSRLQDGSAVAAAEADFALARRLGVSTYPTLLLVNGQEAHSLPANGVGLDDMNRRLDALLA